MSKHRANRHYVRTQMMLSMVTSYPASQLGMKRNVVLDFQLSTHDVYDECIVNNLKFRMHANDANRKKFYKNYIISEEGLILDLLTS